jgi:hypothetical protein
MLGVVDAALADRQPGRSAHGEIVDLADADADAAQLARDMGEMQRTAPRHGLQVIVGQVAHRQRQDNRSHRDNLIEAPRPRNEVSQPNLQ